MKLQEEQKTIGTLAESLGCTVRYNESMANHTSFHIGGPCTMLIEVDTVSALQKLMEEIQAKQLPYFVLGKGSNLLVSDQGLDAIVLQLTGEFCKSTVTDNTITCGAGASLTALCKAAKDHSLTGLEFAYGIPGSVGGGLFMNAGAYGGELCQVVQSAMVLLPDGTIKPFAKEDLHLSYRHSIFHEMPGIILSVTVCLQPGDSTAIENSMQEILKRRQDKQPLDYPSAGSVFKRPIGQFAGTLIEECGLKGKQIGGAKVSEKHAGFIINAGGATCQNVLDLVAYIQKTVQANTGTALECEIRPIGRGVEDR